MKKLAVLAAAAAVLFAAAAAQASPEGVWSAPGRWAGGAGDDRGPALAKKIRAKVLSRQTSPAVYDVTIDFKPGAAGLFPATVDKTDAGAGRPANIVWTGKYNGFNEEAALDYLGHERCQAVRFTCTKSESGDKLFGLEGLVTWTPSTKRGQDKICVFWDSSMRASVYLGASFEEVMELAGVETPVAGYSANDGHAWRNEEE